MTVPTIDALAQSYIRSVAGALNGLQRKLAEPSETRRRLGDRSWSKDPADVAKEGAAASIFAAEGKFARACLNSLSESGGGIGMVLEARAAGDAILRFAASGFKSITGGGYSSDHRVKQLFAIADAVPTSGESGTSGSRLAVSPRISPAVSPRISPMG